MNRPKQKKTVGILTILDVANFGSMLQAYALGRVVERLGYEALFIDYHRPSYTTWHKVRTFLADPSLGSLPKRMVFAASALFFYANIRRRIRRFVRKAFRFSAPYHDCEALRRRPPRIDVAISGSDQIWNSAYNDGLDKAFFLDFTDCPKIAYAASVGMNEFPGDELPEVKKLLSGYKAISVRESQTCDYLHQLGFRECVHVLDPSLLLTADEWRKVAGVSAHSQEDPYLLVYSVERFNNAFIFEQARRIAQARNLRLYVVCSTYPVRAKEFGFDRIFALADVRTFLRLMEGADFVVASSFHGTAFALNFNKDFITITPDRFNIRMESLVREFGVAGRVVTTDFVSIDTLQPIDYPSVNQKLTMERERSIQFLNKALNK